MRCIAARFWSFWRLGVHRPSKGFLASGLKKPQHFITELRSEELATTIRLPDFTPKSLNPQRVLDLKAQGGEGTF